MSPCSICPLRFAGPPFCCSHTCAGGGISGKKQLQIAGCTCAHALADNALRQGPHDRRHVGKGAGDCTRQRERNVHIGSQTCPGSERGRTHRAPGCRFPCRTDPPPCRKRRNERGLTCVCVHTPLVPGGGSRSGACRRSKHGSKAQAHMARASLSRSPLICAGATNPFCLSSRPTHCAVIRCQLD